MFDNGQTLSLSDIPVEFQPFFNAIYLMASGRGQNMATEFQSLLDWDAASFATLIVLQFLNTNGKKNAARAGEQWALSDTDCSRMMNPGSIDRLQSTVVNALKDHCSNVVSSSSQPSKLSRIVSQVRAHDIYR